MTKLREGVNLRSLEQRSPLNIYIEDGNNLFERMKTNVVTDTITSICNLSLPNETIEITNALDEFTNSEEFKKKEYGNQKKIEQNFNNAISFSGTTSSEFDSFISSDFENKLATPAEEEIEKEIQYEEFKQEENIQPAQPMQSTEPTPYGFELPTFENTKADMYELNNGTSEVNILEKKSNIFENSFIEIKNSFNELDPEQTPHVAQAEDEFVFENQELQEDINEINNLEQQENVTEEIVEEFVQEPIQEELVKEESLSEEDINKILEMPAFKNGEEPLTIGSYLDNILDNLNIDYDQDKEISQQLNNENGDNLSNQLEDSQKRIILDNNENEINITEYDNEIELLDESERETIKEEIKKSMDFGLSKDPDFIKYRNSIFVNKRNDIDYKEYKKIDDEVSDDDIKPFYKLPKITKKEPGTLFGGKLLNKTPFTFQNRKQFDEEKRMKENLFKEKNQVSENELNNLLLLDDEKERLEKINNLLNKEDPETIEQRELNRQIEEETPVFYIEDINENENLDDFIAVEELPNQEKEIINQELENQDLEAIEFEYVEVSEEEMENIEKDEMHDLEKDIESEIDQELENLSDEDKVIVQEIQDEMYMDSILEDVKDLSTENADVIKSLLKEKNKNLSDIEMIPPVELVEEEIDDNQLEINNEDSFLNNIKIVKAIQKENEDETEIIQEINQPTEVHNFQKDIIEYLRNTNSKK